jgi:hypothetical protein
VQHSSTTSVEGGSEETPATVAFYLFCVAIETVRGTLMSVELLSAGVNTNIR